jgi:hypothetical protein
MHMIVRSYTRNGWRKLMTRIFWDDLLNLVRKSFFTIHVCIFFQASSDLNGQAHLLFDQFFPIGPLRLRIQRKVLLSRLMDKGWNHSWIWWVRRLRRLCWRIPVIQSDRSSIVESLAEDWKLSVCWRQPSLFSLSLNCLFCFCCVF